MSMELIIATFEQDENGANQVLERIKKLTKDKLLVVRDVATIVKSKDGTVTVKDAGDIQAGRGAVFGAITGAIVGLLGGPVGAIAGAVAGAATGGAAAKIADYGVSNKMINDVKNGLQPGSSAIIAYVELDWLNKALNRLEEAGATVYHETLEGDMAEELFKQAAPSSKQ
ncbi:MAG TPA: DUF1269 domain-containing protein [Anaerolineae bacterium]|nr:DUF1269 domain-containing protein [Anaerolineae bacterium]